MVIRNIAAHLSEGSHPGRESAELLLEKGDGLLSKLFYGRQNLTCTLTSDERRRTEKQTEIFLVELFKTRFCFRMTGRLLVSERRIKQNLIKTTPKF